MERTNKQKEKEMDYKLTLTHAQGVLLYMGVSRWTCVLDVVADKIKSNALLSMVRTAHELNWKLQGIFSDAVANESVDEMNANTCTFPCTFEEGVLIKDVLPLLHPSNNPGFEEIYDDLLRALAPFLVGAGVLA